MSAVGDALAEIGAAVNAVDALGPSAVDLAVAGDLAAVRRAAGLAVEGMAVDVCAQAAAGRRKRLLVADMDSTIVGCECLDQLADLAGFGPEVAAITERAMRGELAFEPALRQRVALLQGLPLAAAEQCLAERVRLNPGAATLVRTMAAAGSRCVLVTGGFDVFAEPVAAKAGFHRVVANRLLHDGGRLTGGVAEPIVGRTTKRDTLLDEARALDLLAAETLAVGDGANDLEMIAAAGLGVAWRAKPILAEAADARVSHANLTALLYFQGYRTADLVSAAGTVA